jgi:hypothetical protein
MSSAMVTSHPELVWSRQSLLCSGYIASRIGLESTEPPLQWLHRIQNWSGVDRFSSAVVTSHPELVWVDRVSSEVVTSHPELAWSRQSLL